MITFTPSAIAHIHTMLKNKGESVIFRLSIKKTGCSGYMYVPEILADKKDTDIEIPGYDFPIYLDKDAIALIEGTDIDYVKKGLGVSQLEFRNPNAEGLCGCGESFKIKSDDGLQS